MRCETVEIAATLDETIRTPPRFSDRGTRRREASAHAEPLPRRRRPRSRVGTGPSLSRGAPAGRAGEQLGLRRRLLPLPAPTRPPRGQRRSEAGAPDELEYGDAGLSRDVDDANVRQQATSSSRAARATPRSPRHRPRGRSRGRGEATWRRRARAKRRAAARRGRAGRRVVALATLAERTRVPNVTDEVERDKRDDTRRR